MGRIDTALNARSCSSWSWSKSGEKRTPPRLRLIFQQNGLCLSPHFRKASQSVWQSPRQNMIMHCSRIWLRLPKHTACSAVNRSKTFRTGEDTPRPSMRLSADIVDALGQSSTLLAASLTRPCPWCDVHFQKSAKEHRKKCLPLLQLSLRHDTIADTSGAGTTTSGGVGTQLSSCRDADTRTPGKCSTGREQILDSQTSSGRASARERTRVHKPSEAGNRKPKKNFGWIKIN